VEFSHLAGDALADDAGVTVDEDAHGGVMAGGLRGVVDFGF
jgi:hypothetical protein